MDRTIVYPASIPQDTDILNPQRNIMVALGYLAQMALGTGPVVDGLACTPTAPASMAVMVGPGSILALASIDPNPYGTLPADGTDPLVKIGINTTPTSFPLTAPSTSGQAINYLIEASFQESDTGAVVLPYYNSANPQQPFAGPANSGITQNTQRIQRVELQLKAGAPATVGQQTTPSVDTGWVGLYVVTVPYGATALTAANIATLPGAPFVPFKLPALRPGFSQATVFNASGVFTVPAGVTQVRVSLVGGGGGGGGGGGVENFSGAGGGGGGYGRGVFTMTPGAAIAVTVGAGGNGGGNPGGTGGTSSFGYLISATGGQGGSGGGGTNASGGGGGGATGGSIMLGGAVGNDGFYGSSSYPFGRGGASFFGGAGRAGAGGGVPGTAPGAGGGGAYGGVAGPGGSGAAGIVIIEY